MRLRPSSGDADKFRTAISKLEVRLRSRLSLGGCSNTDQEHKEAVTSIGAASMTSADAVSLIHDCYLDSVHELSV